MSLALFNWITPDLDLQSPSSWYELDTTSAASFSKRVKRHCASSTYTEQTASPVHPPRRGKPNTTKSCVRGVCFCHQTLTRRLLFCSTCTSCQKKRSKALGCVFSCSTSFFASFKRERSALQEIASIGVTLFSETAENALVENERRESLSCEPRARIARCAPQLQLRRLAEKLLQE